VAYKFLSDDWIAAARKIREETSQEQATPPQPLKMNLVITEVPFGEGSVQAHIDTTGGQVEMDLGHLDNPEVTATLDYDTARAIMVDSDPQVGMQAFMAGKIKLQGDMTKALAMQSGSADPELTRKIQEITE
jgi:putative sterol carrier protein